MYAVIETGGKQYRVQEGDTLDVEYLTADEGQTIELGRVLLVGGDGNPAVGQPVVDGALVRATVVAQARDDKKIIFRYHNKNRYRVKKGHRQPITRLRIDTIVVPGVAAAVEMPAGIVAPPEA
ncbi:MAG TPA: 50S ribosomal protein L21 [Ardenticatenaceae bacterium]|nr:50S ribosomal protein L21 [Ardenticatenaceae bacterium]